MVKVKEDLTGKVFGYLTVLEQAEDSITHNGQHLAAWKCQCKCGKIVSVRGHNLKTGGTKSCGCYNRGERAQLCACKRRKKFNNYYEKDNIIYVQVFHKQMEKEFIIDKEDLSLIDKYHWHLTKEGYVRAYIPEKNKHLLLHQLLLNSSKEKLVDHKNLNKLDNRKENLRICDYAKNSINKNKNNNLITTSIYKGVWWDKQKEKWISVISYQKKRIFIGYFTDEKEAALAYDKKAKELYEDFAYLNFNNINEDK